MTMNTLVIPIAFALMFVGLGWLVIHTRTNKNWWWVTLIYLTITISFVIAVWDSVGSYRGWPATEQTPKRFVLLSAKVDEPEPSINSEGAIYVWVLAYESKPAKPGLLDYHPEPGEPRAFKLPYSREMHEQMEKAMGMIRAGKTVIMGRRKGKPGDGEPGDGKEGDGRDGRGRRGGHEAIPYDELFFYEMPPPALPGKHEP